MNAVCRICESLNTSTRIEGNGHWHCVDPVVDRQFPYRVVVCEECGHVSGIWDRDRNVQYVEEEYITCDDDLEQYTAYVEFVLAGVKAMNRAPRLAEIGFNRGALMRRFSDIGFECHGIEPGAENVRAARKRIANGKLEQGFFGADWISQYPEGYFDVIMMTSVFEHVTEPFDILRTVRPYLKPDGQLFLVVPDLSRYTPTYQANAAHRSVYGCSPLVFFYRNFFLCYGQHINHFSGASLARYLAAAGLKTTRIADIGNLWVSASPADPVGTSLQFPEIVDYHHALMDHYEDLLNRTRACVVDRLAGRRIVCYGAGKEFGYFHGVFSELGVDIIAVGDDAPQRQSVHGVTCTTPDALMELHPEVCVATSFDYEDAIAAKARELLGSGAQVYTLTELLSQLEDPLPNFTSIQLDPGTRPVTV